MINKTKAYAAQSSHEPLTPFQFERRAPGPKDVLIDILYCGICHSDIHSARNEWGGASYPMVPGHAIVGKVTQVGSEVKKFRAGDTVGVGCFVDSCRRCESCSEGLEVYCENLLSFTYNSTEQDGKTPTQGGYSTHITVNEDYVLRVSDKLPLERVAPLLCAGITTYSPLRHFGLKAGQKLGVVGLGGLGHMAVKIGAAMGADVTVFSTSPKKEADARKLGAHQFIVTRDPAQLEKLANQYHLILDTVSAPHDLNMYLNLLKRDGTLVLVGLPDQPAAVHAFPLVIKRRRLAGSLIGGIRETQEMLDFCAKHEVLADIELIQPSQINEAFERTIKADVRYRFVIDCKKF